MKNKSWFKFCAGGLSLLFFFLAGRVSAEEKIVRDLVTEGNAFYLKGEFRKAMEAYQEALLQEMEDVTKAKIHYNLGNSHYRLGEFEKALKEYQESLRLNPDDTDAKFNLEMALRALQGERGLLKEGPSEIQGGSKQEALDEEVRLILQRLEQTESRDPKGLPVPPSDEKKTKEYKKDW